MPPAKRKYRSMPITGRAGLLETNALNVTSAPSQSRDIRFGYSRLRCSERTLHPGFLGADRPMNETSGSRATHCGRRPEPPPRRIIKRVSVRLTERSSSCSLSRRFGSHRIGTAMVIGGARSSAFRTLPRSLQRSSHARTGNHDPRRRLKIAVRVALPCRALSQPRSDWLATSTLGIRVECRRAQTQTRESDALRR